MIKKIGSISMFFFTVLMCAFCSTSLVEKKSKTSINRNDNIDTFRIKYSAEIHGRVKSVDEYLYVGTGAPDYIINNREYKSFVFGNSINSVIALIRQDNDSLSYVNTKGIDSRTGTNHEDLLTGTLLYFDKQVNYKWKVDIDSSYFWKREITFAGTKVLAGEDIYIYNMNADETHSDMGDHISKIYYSKNYGFMKFELKTHWFPVEVNKLNTNSSPK